MKIEKLNDNKIRITLNLQDLSERNLDFHSFMSNSVESQSIFLDMLSQANKEVGFNTDDCKIMVEVLVLDNERFILTITKFEHKADEKTQPKKKPVHIKRKNPTINFDKTIYSFDTFDTFCEFCTFLRNTLGENQIKKFAKTSDLYEYNSNFYLVFTSINQFSESFEFICSSITEFAHFVDSSKLFESKLKEYGKTVITKSAITTCMEYFV